MTSAADDEIIEQICRELGLILRRLSNQENTETETIMDQLPQSVPAIAVDPLSSEPALFVRAITPNEGQQIKLALQSMDESIAMACRILLASAGGETIERIAAQISVSVDFVHKTIVSFNTIGIAILRKI